MVRVLCVMSLVCGVLLAGCGSGSGGAGSAPGGGVSISAITGPNHLQVGVKAASFIYQATVTGSTNTAVTWSVDDPSLATIDATAGLATPSASKTGTVTITATAAADTSKTSTLKVPVVDWILAGVFQTGVGEGVLLVSADGSTTTSLVSPSENEGNCSWAYDHLTFVCQNYRVAGSMQFDVFVTDGSAQGTVKNNTLQLAVNDMNGIFFTVGCPSFSPDGKEIVFEGITSANGAVALGTYVTNSTGTQSPQLLATDPDVSEDWNEAPRFSPDGKEILFAQNYSVWIMNADGTNQRQLLPSPAQSAVFTSDMTAIYYTGGSTSLGLTVGVFRANPDGSQPVQVTSGYILSDVAPSGQAILLFNPFWGLLGGPSLYVANPDGSNPVGRNGAIWGSW